MRMRCLIFAAGLCLVAVADGRAADTVRRTSGTVLGRVEKMTPVEVTVKEQSSMVTTIPVNEIITIYFDGEPASLKTARSNLLRGAYEDALTALNAVKADEANRDVIQQDIAFYKALCAARLALGGTGTVKDAGGQMIAFAKANSGSYHYLEACEIIGDLLVAIGAYAPAEEYYGRLAKAPWPEYKMRAGVAVGRAQLAQNKTAEAMKSFQEVIDTEASGDSANSQRLAATLGKASCLAATQKYDEAVKMVEEILAKADPEDVALHARAYNTLGGALLKAGRNKEALMAYLHVDVLYFTIPEAHAEALANLAKLWDAEHKTERAVRARAILQEQYGNSPWAK